MRGPRVPVMVLAALTILAQSPAGSAKTDQEIEDQLVLDLRSRNRAAADTFTLANVAKQAGKHEEAVALFGRVTEMVPDFSHAWRRQGYELLRLDRRSDAISRMKTAVRLDESAWNLVGLATALCTETQTEKPSEAELENAAVLVRQAGSKDPEELSVAFLACRLALQTGNGMLLDTEATRFAKLDPENPWAYFFLAANRAMSGDPDGARSRLEQAKALGLPDDVYRDFLTQLDESGPPLSGIAAVGSLVLGGWLAGLLLLLGVGSLLSRITLEASRRVPSHESGGVVGLDARLRKVYRWVLAACCAYYFISIPLVIAVVLLVGGGLVYLMLAAGRVPIKLLLIVVALTLVTLWAIVKSLFIRVRDEDPGQRVGAGEHPRLRKVLDEVAARIGTRPVTNVYLTPGTDMAVMERGGVYRQFRGQTERCLILGIGAIDGMTMRPFRAILAHEYGHFSNEDTAGGGFALAVRRSLVNTAVSLARAGAAAWYNPAWLFVNGFHRLFLRISQGASRLQEVLADRWAAFTYGARAFQEGLRHIIDRSIRFDAHVNSVLTEVVEGKKALTNLYSYRPSASLVEESKLAEEVEEAIQRPPSPYDSHPRPADRFAWVEALGSQGGEEEPDDRDEVWTLFEGRESLERQLTDSVRENLCAAQGIMITKEEPAAG